LQQQGRRFEIELSQVGQPDYIEQIARDKLNLAKPGETVVVPDELPFPMLWLLKNPPTEGLNSASGRGGLSYLLAGEGLISAFFSAFHYSACNPF